MEIFWPCGWRAHAKVVWTVILGEWTQTKTPRGCHVPSLWHCGTHLGEAQVRQVLPGQFEDNQTFGLADVAIDCRKRFGRFVGKHVPERFEAARMPSLTVGYPVLALSEKAEHERSNRFRKTRVAKVEFHNGPDALER